jgi:Ran GTPase-activating protein (RanGAP) involved in mRNA processing and transport
MINNKNLNNFKPNILMFDENSIFNSLRITNTTTKSQLNNQTLFEHSFINEKTSSFILFLEEPKIQNTLINLTYLIDNRKGFEEFQNFFDWEYYELILFLATCKMNSDIFERYNEFIMIYLFNGMEKLNNINFLIDIKSNEKYCPEKLFAEIINFYNQKKEDFRQNSEDDYFLTCAFDEKKFFCSCFIFYKMQKCKQLDFTEYKFNKLTIQPLLSALKFKENIVELNLSYNDIGNEGCYCLGDLLKINKNLSILTLSFCNIDNNALKFLLRGLKCKSHLDKFNLTQLNLSDNNITEDGGEYLGQILIHLNRLQWLNISNNKINNKGAIKLFLAYKEVLDTDYYKINEKENSNSENNQQNCFYNLNITNNNSSSFNLNNLNINSNNSNNNQKQYNNLETLILIGIGIYSEGCLTILGDIIKHPKCGLKTLVLSKNEIGKSNPHNHQDNLRDIKYFLHCLEQNKSITELLLLTCQIGNDITEEIYKMLKVNRTIEYLVLYNNNINQQMVFLKLLSLFSDIPENKGIINNCLKVLDLSKNNCTIEINNKFLNIIEELQLSSLDISQNELSREGSENFKNLANRIGDKLKIIY